jgi:hypothetical protein
LLAFEEPFLKNLRLRIEISDKDIGDHTIHYSISWCWKAIVFVILLSKSQGSALIQQDTRTVVQIHFAPNWKVSHIFFSLRNSSFVRAIRAAVFYPLVI